MYPTLVDLFLQRQVWILYSSLARTKGEEEERKYKIECVMSLI